MAWIAGIVALVGAGVSAYQQDKAADQQEELANRQSNIGIEDRATYNRLYAPREEQLLNSVFDSGKSPAAEAARAGAEASAAADTAEQVGLRNARRSGVNINSPAFAALNRKSQADRAGLVSSAKTYGRRYADDVNFTRQSAALNMGRNLTSNAITANNASAALYQGLSALNSERDATTGQLLGQAAGYIGTGLSDYLRGRKSNALVENNPNSLDS